MLNCSQEHAIKVFDLMSHLDLSEMSRETFDFEVNRASWNALDLGGIQ